MCGITGFFELPDKNKTALKSIIKNMTDCIEHRGPDADGFYIDETSAVALGHRRLAILDLSENGAQPMTSRSGRYVMIYNGEIYNHLELRKPFIKKGYAFKGLSDTETILALLDEHGFDLTVPMLNGMFAIAIWDRSEQKLLFARDRFGKKPLYIGWVGQTLIFGSELKSLRQFPDMKPEINLEALKAYIRFGYVPAPLCIFQNIISLPGGTTLSITKNHINARAKLSSLIEMYWNPIDRAEKCRRDTYEMDEKDSINLTEKTIKEAVKRRFISDVPLGAFLSGGIDSSLVVSMMQALSSDKVKTYTIGFDEKGFNEAMYAKQVAMHVGTDHHELYLNGNDAMSVIPDLTNMYDEPFSDISQIPTFLVSKFARQDITVALSGDGGDELFGGYNRHISGAALWKKMSWLPPKVRNYLGKNIGQMGPEFWQKVKPNSPQFGERMMKVARAFSAKDEDGLYHQFLSQWNNPNDLLQSQVLGEGFGQLKDRRYSMQDSHSFTHRMMMYDTLHYLQNDVLAKVDRASMANSLETRAPLLDFNVYELAWRLKQNMKIRGSRGKWILRQILCRYIPRELIERPKMGFTVPMATWLRGPLKDWAWDLLDPTNMQKQGYLNPGPVIRAWDDHQSGRANNAYRLWTIIMYQAWLKKWMN